MGDAMGRKKIQLNFIHVEGDVKQIIIDLIKLEINPILSKYNAKVYTDSELSNFITGETCNAEHNEKSDVRPSINLEGLPKG